MARLAAAFALLALIAPAACGGDSAAAADAAAQDAPSDGMDAMDVGDLGGDGGLDVPSEDTSTVDAWPDVWPDASGDTSEDVADPGPGDAVEPDTADADAGDVGADAASVCGDGVQEGDEACDDGAANSDTAKDACRTSCELPRCGDGVQDSGEACDDGNDDNLDGCTSACEPGAAVPAPAPGEVVVAELMANPAVANDPVGEWMELVNTAAGERNLTGCVVRDEGTDHFVIGDAADPVVVAAGGRVVLAADGDPAANGGVDVDFVYGAGMLLDNFTDEVIVECAGLEVDRVAYAAPTWEVPSGASLKLDPSALDAAANDAVESWCPGETPYGPGDGPHDLGTPGEANPACPPPDTTVDLCAVGGASAATGFAGYPVALEVYVTEAWITDLTDGVDVPAVGSPLLVEVGVGPDGTDPAAADAGWEWSPAGAVAGWHNGAGVGAYQGEVTAAAAGDFDAAARASRDSGATWTLCDHGAGSADGYAPADATQLTVSPDPCAGALCQDPPPAGCADDQLTVLTPPSQGSCVPTAPGEYRCDYPPVETSCAPQGLLCDAGACAGAVPPPPAGGLMVAEVMPSPSAPDYLGEWFELANTSGGPVDLGGCVLSDGAADSVPLEGPLVMAPGARLVLGRSGNAAVNGGLAPDVALGDGFVLDKADRLTVTCGGVVAADLQWTVLWPFSGGTAMQLSPYADPALAGELGSWCAAPAPFGVGDLGSPGQPNPPCPGDVVPVTACRVAEQATFAGAAGVTTELHATVTVAGVTDATGGQDAGSGIQVRVGYALDTPTLGADADLFAWHPAAPTAGWVDDDEPGADGYHVRLRAPAAGDWRVAARASADGGHTWTLCDGTPDDGVFTPSEAPLWQVAASACDPDPCGAAPATDCDGDWVVTPKGLAACSVDADAGGVAVCAWAFDPVEDCAASLATCQAGACVGGPVVPAHGDVIFSELAVTPAAGPLAEWVELTNTTDQPLDLTGCTFTSAGSAPLMAPDGGPLYMGPGAVWLVARTGDAGGAAALSGAHATYAGVALPNDGGTATLSCGGAEVDAVAWGSSAGIEAPVHGTLSLSGSWQAAGVSEGVERWCMGAVVDATDTPPGTPGAMNPLCPALDTVVDDCAFVGFRAPDAVPGTSPSLSAAVTAGEEAHALGRLLEAWVSDATSGTDAAPGVSLEVGWGPPGTAPDAAWTWVAAAPDASWDDAAEPGWQHWDQWATGGATGGATADAALTWHDVGSWDVAARVTVDGGATWTLCDGDGAANGYDPAQAGHVDVAAGPCEPSPCQDAPATACDAAGALTISLAPGGCALDDQGAPVCSYDTVSFDCADFGGCEEGDATCASLTTPAAAGELVVSEVMPDSADGGVDDGEWVELTNTTDHGLDTRGCELLVDDQVVGVVAGEVPVAVAAGAALVVGPGEGAAGQDGGVGPLLAASWGGAPHLGDLSGSFAVRCGGVELDRAVWAPGWPFAPGQAMSLSAASVDAVAADPAANDVPDVWCPAQGAYGDGSNKGTPGAPNPACP